MDIQIRQDTVPSIVLLEAYPEAGEEPLLVEFYLEVHGGDPPLSYSWQFGDGSGSAAPQPTHVYANSGVYPATVEVTDSDGDTDFEALTITVVPAS